MCDYIDKEKTLDTWTKAYKVVRVYKDKEYTGPFSKTLVIYRKVLKSIFQRRGVNQSYKGEMRYKKTKFGTENLVYGFCVFPSLETAKTYMKFCYKGLGFTRLDLYIRHVEVKGTVFEGSCMIRSTYEYVYLPVWAAEKMKMFGRVKNV